jgi:RNA polymerase sigma-70 factor (sigma-E family)
VRYRPTFPAYGAPNRTKHPGDTHGAREMWGTGQRGALPAQDRESRWKFAGRVRQQDGGVGRFLGVELEEPGGAAAVGFPGPPRPPGPAGGGGDAWAGAEAEVTALYEASALGLIRMAYVVLGDLPSAEDVVQEAFYGLYRRWDRLADPAGATYYVRTSVLNGCRSALRHRAVRRGFLQHRPLADPPPAVSAETVVLGGEEREDVIRALRRLPDRQREVLVLRFYAELPDEEIGRVMGIRPGTVRSTAFRALDALGRALKETP